MDLFTKDLKWRNARVATPAATATASTAGGTLAGGTYGYKVVAYAPCGNYVTCRSAASTEVKAIVSSGTTGSVTLNIYFIGAEIRRNVLAGGVASKYPPENFFPPASEFLAQFVNPSAGDYHLAVWSPYRAAGTDGKDVGVDIDALVAAMK